MNYYDSNIKLSTSSWNEMTSSVNQKQIETMYLFKQKQKKSPARKTFGSTLILRHVVLTMNYRNGYGNERVLIIIPQQDSEPATTFI